MVIYDSVRSIMNTTENMEHLIINTRYDGTTLQYQGVDWFQFNGKVISNIYEQSICLFAGEMRHCITFIVRKAVFSELSDF